MSNTLAIGSIVRIVSPHNFYNGRLAIIIGHVQFATSELDCYWVRITGTRVTCLERANELRAIDATWPCFARLSNKARDYIYCAHMRCGMRDVLKAPRWRGNDRLRYVRRAVRWSITETANW